MVKTLSPQRKRLFSIIMIALVLLMVESISWASLHYAFPKYQNIRNILTGKEAFTGLQNVIGQPYLLYSLSPHLSELGHNQDGYRGERIPLDKDTGTYRILFMGGSTTYSIKVRDYQQTYPSQIQNILQAKFPNSTHQKVEIINAGMPWGTSAEIMIHYLMKYRYYQPDLVVINTGGNDAYAFFLGASNQFQPDLSHFRKSMQNIQPLSAIGRFLLRSNTLSLFYIYLNYQNATQSMSFVHDGDEFFIRWMDDRDCLYDTTYNPFYHNIRAAVREMQADGAEVLLIPFLENRSHPSYTEAILAATDHHKDMLKRIAEEEQTHFAPFEDSVISNSDYWLDDCHLNEAGVLEKAEHLAPYILHIIQQDTSK